MGKRLVQSFVTSIAAALALFAMYLQLMRVLNGDWVSIGTFVFYCILAGLFIFRKSSREASTSWKHWIFALGGTWMPYFIHSLDERPDVLLWIGLPLQVVSLVCVIIAVSALGRGFGIIAARREIKTHGPYRLVRHPLYAAEIFLFLSIVIQNLSAYNALVFVTFVSCQVRRMFEEEAVLGRDESYARYLETVPYRILPGVF